MLRRLPLIIGLMTIGALVGVLILQDAETTEAQTFGSGTWTANFYNNTSLSGTPSTTTYNAVNFSWGTGPPTDSVGNPVPGINADNFSARFTSTQSLVAGTYTFTMTADDRATLTINGVQVINIDEPNTTRSQQATLPGGAVNLQVEYVEFTGPAFLQLQWTAPAGGGGQQPPPPGSGGGGQQPPPPTPTITPTPPPTNTPLPAIPPGALTGTVVRANVLNARQAPSTGAPVVARLLRGQTYAIIGRDADARWFLLQLTGRQAWAWGYYLFIDGNEFNAPEVSGNTLLDLAGLQDYGVRAQTEAGLKLRAAPTIRSEQIGRIGWGQFLPVVGRTPSGRWWKVVWKETVGWVYAPYLKVVEGDIQNAPLTNS